MTTVFAQPRINEVIRLGLGRPRATNNPPRRIGPLWVPTGGTIATLVLAGLRAEPLKALDEALQIPEVGRQRASLRALINKAIDGDTTSFRPEWIDALARVCDLSDVQAETLHAALARSGEMNPRRLEHLVAGMRRAQRALAQTNTTSRAKATLQAVEAWLECLRDSLTAPPPWAIDAPPDLPRTLSSPEDDEITIVSGGSGEGKTRWLRARAAAVATDALTNESWYLDEANKKAPLPLYASAHTLMAKIRQKRAEAAYGPWEALVDCSMQPALGLIPPDTFFATRQYVLEAIYRGDPLVAMIDGLDELSTSAWRDFVAPHGLIGIARRRRNTQLILTTRNESDARQLSSQGVRSLRSITSDDRHLYWRNWRNDAAEVLISRVRDDSALDALLRNPFLAALAVSSTEPAITRTSLLRSAIPRILGADWRERSTADDSASLQLRERLVQEIAWTMAADTTEWRTSCTRDEVVSTIELALYPRQLNTQGSALSVRRMRRISREVEALTTILPGLRDESSGSIAFVHPQIQCYLVACRLARNPEAHGYIRERWWHHPDWRQVAIYLAGITPDPETLLGVLDDEGDADPLGIIDDLVVRALAEVSEQHFRPTRALMRVQASLSSSNVMTQTRAASSLALLGARGFRGVPWTSLAPIGVEDRVTGHVPNSGFTFALRASAKSASDVLTAMVSGHYFASYNLPGVASAMESDPASNGVRALPDALVYRLATLEPAEPAPRAHKCNLLKAADTEATLRNLLPTGMHRYPPDLEVLVREGMPNRAVEALVSTEAKLGETRTLWEETSISFAKDRLLNALSVDGVARVASNESWPMSIRAPALLRMIRIDDERSISLARTLKEGLAKNVRVLVELADHGALDDFVTDGLRMACETSMRAAIVLARRGDTHAIAALRRHVMDARAGKGIDGEGCCHDLLMRFCKIGDSIDRRLWHDVILEWTECPDGPSDSAGQDLVFSKIEPQFARDVAVSARSHTFRERAIALLDRVRDRDVLIRIASDPICREQVVAIKKLAADDEAARCAIALIWQHLEVCGGIGQRNAIVPCCGMFDWVWTSPIRLAVMRDEVFAAWQRHAEDLVARAEDGDEVALAELYGRADRSVSEFGKAELFRGIRTALTTRARRGEPKALQLLEKEAVRSCAPGGAPMRGHLDNGSEWVRSLAQASPSKAREVILSTFRQRPGYRWMLEVLADLGSVDACSRLIELYASGARVQSGDRGIGFSSGFRAGSSGLQLTEPAWLRENWPGVSKEALENALLAVTQRMSITSDLDGDVAAVARAVANYGSGFSVSFAKRLRSYLMRRAGELRDAYVAPAATTSGSCCND